MKYPISKEFFPYSHMVAPANHPRIAGFLGSLMRPPRRLFRDREVRVVKESCTSFDGASVELLVFDPYGIEEPAPCLLYFHGGGFVFGAAGHHYRMAKRYALETPCKLIFVEYRLAPRHPHPCPSEDCYAALLYAYENAARLHIDPEKIAVGGDSAGGALAAAVCQMARDRGKKIPCFSLLIYPVTDRRMQTASQINYTDTPMWNSRLNRKMWQSYTQKEPVENLAYASPMETSSFAALPPAYVESAEFDCLHDEALAYAAALCDAGIEAEVYETKGTMHGYDTVEKSPTAKAALIHRIAYMQKKFYG